MQLFNPFLEEDLEYILCHTRDFWEDFRGKTIFLTGGTGFFGKWLLESYLYASHRLQLDSKLIVLSRNSEKFLKQYPLFNQAPIKFINGDIRSFQYPKEAIHYIIHAATEASEVLNRENPLFMIDTIVAGTSHVLELAKQKSVQAFLLTSSGAVYGKQPENLVHVSEDYVGGPDQLHGSSAYAEGKRMAELLCSIYAQKSGVEAKTARCFAFVGPYLPLDTHFAVGNFIRNRLHNEPLIIKGDGTPYRSYLYASDLVVWLLTILLKGETGRAYNVGSDQEITIADLAQTIAALEQPSLEVRILNTTGQQRKVERYTPDIQRAKRELGVRPTITLQEALRKTVAWHRRQRDDSNE